MQVLVVNTGSSSVKLRLLDGAREVLVSHDSAGAPDQGRLEDTLKEFAADHRIDALGHRVVHGGTFLTRSTRIDPEVRSVIESLTPLAPLHQPVALLGIDAAERVLPGVPSVACFDTAFHATIGPAASTYALPLRWRDRYGIRRYGFHGLSHAYAARRAAELVGRDVANTRIVTCHLGAGASLAAVSGGCSVDTTMGFTPLEGLVMATRSGTIDPGIPLWLLEHAGLAPTDVANSLEHESGLKGLTGHPDMRAVISAADAGDAAAQLAVAIYVHRLSGSIASMTASMGGVDVVVFTGGVGENAPDIRRRAAEQLAFLGIEIDAARNTQGPENRDIGSSSAAVRCVVVEAREDLEIAREVHNLLEDRGSRSGPLRE